VTGGALASPASPTEADALAATCGAATGGEAWFDVGAALGADVRDARALLGPTLLLNDSVASATVANQWDFRRHPWAIA
jgi:hypothetical protein